MRLNSSRRASLAGGPAICFFSILSGPAAVSFLRRVNGAFISLNVIGPKLEISEALSDGCVGSKCILVEA